MKNAILAAGAACAIACTIACTPDLCPQLGCVISPWIFVVDDIAADDHLRPGAYTFTLDADYAKVEWECEVPLGEGLDSACSRTLTAMGELDGQPIAWVVDVVNGANGVEIALIEYRDDASVVTGPAQFSLDVTRDGVQQASGKYSPTYSGSWINGEGCAPYCAQASETVELHLAP